MTARATLIVLFSCCYLSLGGLNIGYASPLSTKTHQLPAPHTTSPITGTSHNLTNKPNTASKPLTADDTTIDAPTLTVTHNTLTNNEADENVTLTLKQLQGSLLRPLTEQSVYLFMNEAPRAIKKALEPFGYFRSLATATIQNDNHHWTVHFNIDPGPRLIYTQVTVNVEGQGHDDPVFQKEMATFPINLGDPLNAKTYDTAKRSLFSLAGERGYFQAKMIKSQLIIDLIHYTAKVVIIFDTGPRYRFGPTQFSEYPLTPSLLHRYLTYQPGEYYDANKLQKSQQNLMNSNYFQEVNAKPVPEHATHTDVPIEVHLTPRKSKQYIMGLGYGTDTGARGTLGVTLRRLNCHGHRFSALAQGSFDLKNSQVNATYTIPGSNPASDQYNFSAGYGRISQVIGDARNFNVSASYSSIYANGLLKQQLGLTYLNENYQIQDTLPVHANVLFPNASWQLYKADDPFDPNNGIRLTLNLAGAAWSIGRTPKFFQGRLDLNSLFTLAPTHTRFLLRGELGHTIINNILSLPLSLQLLAGGARSIRGFSYNSIGPGRNLFVGSAEIQQQVYKNWYLAGFIDMGNVTNGNPFAINHLNIGVGPAIVLRTPVGSLSLSAAKPISEPNGGKWRIQFSMGPTL